MLNWAARYFPIIRTLKRHNLFADASLLEIGCGPRGIGTFRKVPFTGCDLSFSSPPIWPMTAVVASAAELPMADKSFDVVLGSDVLEHIPPALRTQVIAEALRVCSKLVIFGFPCGAAAHQSDQELRAIYMSKNLPVPEWLEEHMLADFPAPELFDNLPGWKTERFSNERISFHQWMSVNAMSTPFMRATRKLVHVAPALVEPWLRTQDGEPSYRQIFVLTPR